MKLERAFYMQSGLELARALIGKQLVHRTTEGTVKGVIVETEAYMGHNDAAAHSYRSRRTPRTEIQFGAGGFAYIYSIYGLHVCMNVVANGPGIPEAVLIRALRPTEGQALMSVRRGTEDPLRLCSGPGRLCQAMGITRADYGRDLCGETLYIEAADPVPEIAALKRINVDYAGAAADYPWRFVWKGSPFVSVPPRE